VAFALINLVMFPRGPLRVQRHFSQEYIATPAFATVALCLE